MKKLFLLLLLTLIVACSGSTSFVEDATAADWIWGIEELSSGSVRVWLRHDNLAGYCSADPELAKEIKDYIGEFVLIHYESTRWTNEGCARLPTGVDTSTPIFKITDIEPLPGE